MVAPTSRKKAGAESMRGIGSLLRSFSIWLLVAVTAIGVVAFTAVRWTEKQILNTDNWVAFIAPLPKDPAVSEALSNTVANKIFSGDSVENYVADALPPRAGFLAPPLTEQLETITKRTTIRVIESDKFQDIWIAANRSAHTRVLARARDDQSETQNQQFRLNLSSVSPVIRERLGQVAEALPERDGRVIDVTADLQSKPKHLGQYIRAVDFLHSVLPFLFLTTLLGALAISLDRRKVLLVLSVVVLVLSLLQLIGVKALRPVILNKVQAQQNRPAVSAVYDSLLSSFNTLVYGMVVAALLLWLVMVLAGPGVLGTRLRRLIRMNQIQSTRPYEAWRKIRLWVADQKHYLWSALTIVALFYLAFVVDIDWKTTLNASLIVLSGVALIQVIASPPYLIQVRRGR